MGYDVTSKMSADCTIIVTGPLSRSKKSKNSSKTCYIANSNETSHLPREYFFYLPAVAQYEIRN